MKFRVEKYILKKAEELAFLKIKNGADFNLKGYTFPKEGLDVPIKNDVLVKGIKTNTAQDGLSSMSIADAMIYIMGIDSNFKYNDEYKKFLKAIEENLDLDLKSYMGYMSRKYFEVGDYTDSLIYLKCSVDLYPDDVNSLYHYAIVCQELAKQHQKNGDEKPMEAFLLDAIEALEKVRDLDESFALAHYHLGYHYYNQNQYIKTKVTWEEAIKLGLPEDFMAEIQEILGKMDFKVQYEEGYNLVFQGKNEEALEKLLPLADEHGDWWNLLFMIGLAYRNMNDVGQAKKYFEKILIIRPNQVDTLVELGLCEASSYNMKGAIEYFEKAAKLKKEDPEILCNLGMAYLNDGDLDNATYYIERAYEIDPQDEVTLACLRELNNFR
ncbi:tetratricopeptide repeat protein [Paraclostridium dentum]|uniref:tetratricopeptide repeat protein n=1 Tax=Paraclostridium dentum TaxID=2662455 RepID=UPI003B00F3BD